MSFLGNDKNTYTMDLKQADAMLKNVFAACEQKPNETPLDLIMLRQRAHTTFFRIGRFVTLHFIIFLFIVPFLFPLSNLWTSVKDNSTGLNIVRHYEKDDCLILCLDSVDIDYDSCYMTTRSTPRILPLEFRREQKQLLFPYPTEECNIYIYNNEGKELHLLITPK